ncbi:MAG: efflux RND transporter permease subunit [Pseudomonadales bacterium]|nr:efflux RND transporter permease subunit [Pseudomonadales bacterium]
MSKIIKWFCETPVAANLLMIIILIGGLLGMKLLDKEVFPSIPLEAVTVTMVYPGAGPQEVEQQICVRIEEAVHNLDGIKQINSSARQNVCVVRIEAITGHDTQQLLNEVKGEIDSINTFPSQAERPVIKQDQFRIQVMGIAISGDVREAELKAYTEKIRDEVALLPSVSLVEISATRPAELSIELSEMDLRRYNLDFDDVVRAVQSTSINLPAGEIRSENGDIQIQTRGQAYTREDFENIVLLSTLDGTRIRLGDVATVRDAFQEQSVESRFNGKNAMFLRVYITNKPNVLVTTKVVKAYLKELQPKLPPGIDVTMWMDVSVLFNGRMNTLLTNGFQGLVLVFIVLVLFLRPLLAFWVCAGIAVSFMGTLFILPLTGVSLNMIALFAFMLILGIVVDDAIIVGEAIYSSQQRGYTGVLHAGRAAARVARPVLFAVISSMFAFAPGYFMPGTNAKMGLPIPTIVILTLFFSLLESLLILPAHLATMPPEKPPVSAAGHALKKTRDFFSNGLEAFVFKLYMPLLKKSLARNTTTIAFFFCCFMLAVVYYMSGRLPTAFAPNVPSDFIMATVELPEGGPFSDSLSVARKLENAAHKLKDNPELTGAEPDAPLIKNLLTKTIDNTITQVIELEGSEKRNVSAEKLANVWRESVGPLPNIESFEINYTLNDAGKDIKWRLTADNFDDLQKASEIVKDELSRYPGVYAISDTLQHTQPEIEIRLLPYANNLGITLYDVARQVRQGFYGEEAQRIPRDKDDVKVMIRYSQSERHSLDHFNDIRIRTPDGREVPFEAVAEAVYVPGFNAINRVDRKRTSLIEADVIASINDADKITKAAFENKLPEWKKQFPGFDIKVDGAQQEQSDFQHAMVVAWVVTLLAIYALMALPFHSYWQPFIILTAVPFGFVGSMVGHIVFHKEISIFSMMGITAAAGVVVNDNLVLIDRINELRERGLAILDAVTQGASDRFRPIILTSLTTFIGLIPIMFEKSTQAQFLIPMVISLSFAVLLATTVTLILVPCLYLLGENAKTAMGIKPAHEEFYSLEGDDL